MYFLPNVVIGNTYKNNGFVRRAFGKNAKAYGVAMQKLKNVGKRTRNFDKKALGFLGHDKTCYYCGWWLV